MLTAPNTVDLAFTIANSLGPVAALEPSMLAPYLAQAQAQASRVDNADGAPLYTVDGDGVAVIDIEGALSRYVLAWRGMVFLDGYDRIVQAHLAADADPRVRARAQRIDSPGGTASGLFESIRSVLEAPSRTPVITYLDEMGASAAIAWAYVGSEVYLPREGTAGSIGTILIHSDISRALENAGIKMTAITDPAGKANGWPYFPLTDEAKAALQERVSDLSATFYEHVAARRGMTPDAVRGLNARMFTGQKAVAIGLADGVMSWPQVLQRAGDLGRQKEQERMKSVYVLLGLPEGAKAEDVDKAAAEAKPLLDLGRAALEETGEKDAQAARGALKAMSRDAKDVAQLRAAQQANAAEADKKERHTLLVALAQVEPPALVWKDASAKTLEPHAELAEMATPALRAYVERRTKTPAPVATKTLSGANANSAEPNEEEIKAYAKKNGIKNEGIARAELRASRSLEGAEA